MKKITIYPLLLLLSLLFGSCGVNSAMIYSINQNATEIHLASNNFKVIDQVSGSSEVSYVFLIGGTKKRQLYENAYSDMMKKANLMNGAKAVANVMTEEHFSGFAPFFIRRTLTVSANVVEFTK